MRSLLSIITISFLLPVAQAIVKAPLKTQLTEVDAIIYGKYLGKKYKKMANDDVYTKASFKIIKSAGLSYGQLINSNQFDVLYQGGKWQGLVYSVPQLPNFKLGEEVVLLLTKNSKNGYNLYDRQNGKYLIAKDAKKSAQDEQKIYLQLHNGRQMPFNHFNQMVSRVLGVEMIPFEVNKMATKKSSAQRSIASLSAINQTAEKEMIKESSNVLWLILLLIFFAILSIKIVR